ncbi:class I SAM-dependent methyltransferase family protein [Streptomyces sp. NPDC059037]|uniref:class I SAM-dependent methyltransferase family protein n=1 Tax=Streptomyces sp. NPDC059037 TaxID=3346710 RepID=UPI00367FC2AF
MASPPNRLKWSVIRALLSTVGRTSKGIRTGYRHGFDSGTMLDCVYVNQARDLLQDVLRQEIARRPGREVFIQDLIAPYPPGRVRVLCRDLAGPGLWHLHDRMKRRPGTRHRDARGRVGMSARSTARSTREPKQRDARTEMASTDIPARPRPTTEAPRTRRPLHRTATKPRPASWEQPSSPRPSSRTSTSSPSTSWQWTS